MKENAPYIANLWEIRDILESHIAKNSITAIEEMIPVLEELLSESEGKSDITGKTDLRIILNWLERRKRQS